MIKAKEVYNIVKNRTSAEMEEKVDQWIRDTLIDNPTHSFIWYLPCICLPRGIRLTDFEKELTQRGFSVSMGYVPGAELPTSISVSIPPQGE